MIIYIGGVVGEAIVATTASYEGLQGFSIWLSQSKLLHKVRIIIDGQVHIWRFSDTIDKERLDVLLYIRCIQLFLLFI